MVWILFEVHWDVVDKDGLDCYDENGNSVGTKLEGPRPFKKTALVHVRCDGDLGW